MTILKELSLQLLEQVSLTVAFLKVGLGHFLGEQSILQHLFQLGYRIEPLKNDDTM